MKVVVVGKRIRCVSECEGHGMLLPLLSLLMAVGEWDLPRLNESCWPECPARDWQVLTTIEPPASSRRCLSPPLPQSSPTAKPCHADRVQPPLPPGPRCLGVFPRAISRRIMQV